MVGHVNVQERAEADYSGARRGACFARLASRLQSGPVRLGSGPLWGAQAGAGAPGAHHLMRRLVRSADVVGSVGRSSESDPAFLPAGAGSWEKHKRAEKAFRATEGLPPVELHGAGGAYSAVGGDHRIPVARFRGVGRTDAEVARLGGRRVEDGAAFDGRPGSGGRVPAQEGAAGGRW